MNLPTRAATRPCYRSSGGTGALRLGLATCLRTGRSALRDPAETTPAPPTLCSNSPNLRSPKKKKGTRSGPALRFASPFLKGSGLGRDLSLLGTFIGRGRAGRNQGVTRGWGEKRETKSW